MTTFTCSNVPEQVTFLSCTITQASSTFPTELLSAGIGLLGVAVGTASTVALQSRSAAQKRDDDRRQRLATTLSKSFRLRDLLRNLWTMENLPDGQVAPEEVFIEQIDALNEDFLALQEGLHAIQLLDDDKTVELAERLFNACVQARNFYHWSQDANASQAHKNLKWNEIIAAIEPIRVKLRNHARITTSGRRRGFLRGLFEERPAAR